MAELTSDDLARELEKLGRTIVKAVNDPKGAKSSGDKSGVTWSSTDKDLKGFKQNLSKTGDILEKLGTREFQSMSQSVRSSYSSVTKFGKGMGEAEGITKKFGLGMTASLGLAMAAGAKIASFLKDSLHDYQQTRDYGQNFNGSILGMHLAAAQARMPLDQLTAAMKKYHTEISVVGVQGFSKLSVGLRRSLMDVGQLGMTTGELNDVVGNYMGTMMLFGKAQNFSQQQATMSMRSLSIEASMLAEASGKSRMQLLEDTKNAMNVATLRAVAMDKQGVESQKFIDSMSSATMFLAALPGEAGKTLSNMLAETVGNGSVLLTQDMTEFTKAGMYGIGNLMEGMASKVNSGKKLDAGDMAQFYQEFMKEGKESLETLRFQAAAGNQQAKRMLTMYEDMVSNQEKYTEEALRKAEENQKTQDGVTKAMTNMETMFNEVTGAIKEHFFKAILDFTKSNAFQTLEADVITLGHKLQDLWFKVFTPENLATAATIMDKGFKFLGVVLDKLVSGISTVVGLFNKLADSIGGVKAALVVVASYMLAKFAFNKVKKELADSKARVAAKEGTEAGVKAAIRPLVANSALRVVDIVNGGNHAVDDISGGMDEHHRRRQERMGRVAGRRAMRERGRRLGRMARSVKNFGGKVMGGKLGGAASLAAAGASVALDAAPDFKGKESFSNALSFGAMGAQVGMMFGPLGAAIGGGIGALAGVVLANWEPIKAGLGKALDWLGGAFSSIWDWAKEMFKFTPLGMAYNAFKFVSENGLGGTWEAIKKGFGDAFDSVANIFTSIGSWLSDKFDWLTKFDVMGTIRKALNAVPGVGGTLVKAFDTAVGVVTGGAAGGNEATTVPNVEVDTLKKRIDDMQKQLDQQRKDNQIMHQQLDKLIAEVKHGNQSNAAHQKAQIDETKKGNQALSNPLTGIV